MVKKIVLVHLLCVIILFVVSACGNKSTEVQNNIEDTQPSQSQTVSDTSETEDKIDSSEDVISVDPSVSDNQTDSIIENFNGAADETGIYATVITLSDQAADKGTIEMVYYGPKDSPQENSVVNTFRIEYYKEDEGTFEINTFYDGEVYQNYHHQNKVKVNNTFGAAVRAGNVTVFYTPDGGEKVEIFKADADSFITD